MNTRQKYVGRDSHANPTEQAAEQPPISPFFSPATNFEQANIHRLYRELHQTINDFLLQRGASGMVSLITDLHCGWSLYHFGDEPSKEPSLVSRQTTDDIYATFLLMEFLTSIGESWMRIQAQEECLKLTRQGGTSHE